MLSRDDRIVEGDDRMNSWAIDFEFCGFVGRLGSDANKIVLSSLKIDTG